MVANAPENPGSKIKLLVPTDFSQKSELALDFALKYSRNENADVYLFHSIEAKVSDFRELDRLNVEYMERMKQAVLQAVERLSAQGVTHTVETVHRRISQGKAGLEILKMAAGISADMIIMGAPTEKKFKELVLKAPCTLVLLKEKDLEFIVT